jgi:hypothetical protein
MTAFALLLALAAPATTPAATRAPILSAAIACRAERDDARRLACYDRTLAALDEAERRKDVVIVDQTQIRETKKALFGVRLPRSPVFGGPDIEELHSTLREAQVTGNGPFVFVLADGARWLQVDDAPVAGRPRVGDAVVIRRGVLGSFKLTVGTRPAVKVRRLD